MKDLGNGYYVPDKEDIHLGMRIEFKDPRMLDAWDVNPYLEAYEVGKAENLIKKGYARCQYLREIDLLDEGWEKIGEDKYEKEVVGAVITRIISNWEENSFKINRTIIGDEGWVVSTHKLTGTIFDGYIYSINDYHKLVNLLKI